MVEDWQVTYHDPSPKVWGSGLRCPIDKLMKAWETTGENVTGGFAIRVTNGKKLNADIGVARTEATATAAMGEENQPVRRPLGIIKIPFQLDLAWRSPQPVPLNAVAEFRRWISENDVRILNVAGNRDSGRPGIQEAVQSFSIATLSDF
jgi:Circularly permutated YpsA SLOG family